MTDYNKPVETDNRKLREEDPGIKTHFEAVREETELFPKKNGVIVDEEFVILSDCPVCGSKDSDQLFVKYGFIHVQCRKCSHVFVKNRLREAVLLDIYSKSEVDKLSSVRRKNSATLGLYWNRIYEKYLGYIKEEGIASGNLLDIGCGAGHFLFFCKEKTSLSLYGVDFCEHSRELICGLLGNSNFYFKKKVEDIDFDKKFRVITLWGVFEHICNPGTILKKCRDILDDNGRIIILVPNFFSRAFGILGVKTPTLNPRAHINFYTKKSMEYLCNETGLNIERVFQELPVIDLMYDYVDCNEELLRSIVARNEAYYHVYILKRRSS